MEELIKRLERVIATGAPDKDGMHPISAETVLEVVKGLSEYGTNLASLGTDCISRRSAIDALRAMQTYKLFAGDDMLLIDQAGAQTELMLLPPIQSKLLQPWEVLVAQAVLPQPEIVRCKDCKYAEYIDDVQTLWCTECGQGRTVAPNDFCSYAERREVTT